MIDLFTFAPQDASLKYLAQIFGSVNGVIPVPLAGAAHNAGASGTSITLLGTMFKTFNSVILAVAALIVVYITVLGVMMTAHEGEFMKKWNNIWTPIRTVLGIAALVPSASGYSGLQMIMMWIIVQGIGAADTVWTTALAYVNVAGSPFAQVTIPSVDVKQNLTSLFQGLVCQEASALTYSNPYTHDDTPAGGYWSDPKINATPFTPATFNSPAATTYPMGPGGNCGALTYCDPVASCAPTPIASPIKCAACTAQIAALTSIVGLLQPIAKQYVNDDYAYRNFFYPPTDPTTNKPANVSAPAWTQAYCDAKGISPCTPDKLKDFQPDDPSAPTQSNLPDNVINTMYYPYAIQANFPDFINAASNLYTSAIANSVNEIIQQQVNDPTKLNNQLSSAQVTGWLFAGSYYTVIARQQSNNFKDALPTMAYSGSATTTTNPLFQYRNNFNSAQTLVSAASGNSTSSSGNQQLSGFGQMSSDGLSGVSQAITNNINSSTNPLTALQATGTAMLYAAQILYVTFVIMAALGSGLSWINFMALGFGEPISSAGTAFSTVLIGLILPLFFGMEAFLITFGGGLAVYLPLIPYIIFTFGTLGWFMTTIETMVAGPIVALGIIAPGGQHELLGKADKAIELMFHAFLRPSLMIFGLIAAILLSSVAVNMVNTMFWETAIRIVDLANTGSRAAGMAALGLNPLEFILFLCAYILLIIAVVNKCFQAIFIIPERVFQWIGHHGERYGEESDTGALKQRMEGAGDSAAKKYGKAGSIQKGKAAGGQDDTKGSVS